MIVIQCSFQELFPERSRVKILVNHKQDTKNLIINNTQSQTQTNHNQNAVQNNDLGHDQNLNSIINNSQSIQTYPNFLSPNETLNTHTESHHNELAQNSLQENSQYVTETPTFNSPNLRSNSPSHFNRNFSNSLTNLLASNSEVSKARKKLKRDGENFSLSSSNNVSLESLDDVDEQSLFVDPSV
jgi:hypothetical protein